MSIRPYKRSGKIIDDKWMIDYYDSHGKRQRMVFAGSRAEAEALEVDLRKRHHRSPLINPTINAILPEYLTWMRNHRAAKTVRDIELCLKNLQPHFGPYQVNRITQQLIEEYISRRRAQGRRNSKGERIGDIKPSGINKELAYLGSIISWMVRQDYAYPLPFRIAKLKSRRPLPQVPSPGQIEAFIKALGDPKKQALAGLLYDSGLRWSEATNLTWEKINWETGVILVEGKGGRQRTVFLSDRCRNLLEGFREAAGGDQARGFIFINPRTGRPWGSMKTLWNRISRDLGVRITPHLLRHAYATFTLEATGDLRAVQTELGHSSVGVTEIYTHVSQARRREINRQRQAYLQQQTSNSPDCVALQGNTETKKR